MTQHADGTGECDRCGKALPNTGGGYAVTIAGITADHQPVGLHLCTSKPDPCVPHVLTKRALAHLATPPDWFTQEITDGN